MGTWVPNKVQLATTGAGVGSTGADAGGMNSGKLAAGPGTGAMFKCQCLSQPHIPAQVPCSSVSAPVSHEREGKGYSWPISAIGSLGWCFEHSFFGLADPEPHFFYLGSRPGCACVAASASLSYS
eukprot:1155602-Pelagomonas_calceolata.AAC.3